MMRLLSFGIVGSVFCASGVLLVVSSSLVAVGEVLGLLSLGVGLALIAITFSESAQSKING